MSCVLCGEDAEWVGRWECGHEACWECALRIRLFYTAPKNITCCMCQQPSPTLLLCEPHDTNTDRNKADERGIVYGNTTVRFAAKKLLTPTCPDCGKLFVEKGELTKHLKGEHGKVLCNTCVNARPTFPHEHVTYTPDELRLHEDTKAVCEKDPPNFPGHPSCRFCSKRVYDADAMVQHLHNSHLVCLVCDRMGEKNFIYYQDIPNLVSHYREAHYVCEECVREADYCKQQNWAYATHEELNEHHTLAHRRPAPPSGWVKKPTLMEGSGELYYAFPKRREKVDLALPPGSVSQEGPSSSSSSSSAASSSAPLAQPAAPSAPEGGGKGGRGRGIALTFEDMLHAGRGGRGGAASGSRARPRPAHTDPAQPCEEDLRNAIQTRIEKEKSEEVEDLGPLDDEEKGCLEQRVDEVSTLLMVLPAEAEVVPSDPEAVGARGALRIGIRLPVEDCGEVKISVLLPRKYPTEKPTVRVDSLPGGDAVAIRRLTEELREFVDDAAEGTELLYELVQLSMDRAPEIVESAKQQKGKEGKDKVPEPEAERKRYNPGESILLDHLPEGVPSQRLSWEVVNVNGSRLRTAPRSDLPTVKEDWRKGWGPFVPYRAKGMVAEIQGGWLRPEGEVMWMPIHFAGSHRRFVDIVVVEDDEKPPLRWTVVHHKGTSYRTARRWEARADGFVPYKATGVVAEVKDGYVRPEGSQYWLPITGPNGKPVILHVE